MNEIDHFTELQGRFLAACGVTATSRFVDLAKPVMRVHVLEAGAGEPVLLLHGGDGEGVNWAPTMAHLQTHAHAVAADRPGCGLSDAFDYRDVNLRNHAVEFVMSLLDALDFRSATVVGSSMGGFFALAATLAHPERVNRLVLVGYGVGMVRSVPLPLRIICGIPGLSRRFMKGRPTIEAQRQQYRRMFHVDPDKIPMLHFETRIAGIQLPSAQGRDTGTATWAALLPRLANLRGLRDDVYLGEELPAIGVPTLMIMGEHDMVPPEVARAAMARIPASRFELLSGVGHFPYLEAPERTAEIITEFLRSESKSLPPKGQCHEWRLRVRST